MIPPSEEQVKRWIGELRLSELAAQHILHWFNAQPVAPAETKTGVRGRYPSRRMGRAVEFASHHCELPFLYLTDYHWKDTRVVLDRPCHLLLEYAQPSGRKGAFTFTPHYFHLTSQSADLVECRTRDYLLRLTNPSAPKSQPWRYEQTKEGRWRSIPGEEAAAKFGMGYRIFCPDDGLKTLLRNIEFLADYYDETN